MMLEMFIRPSPHHEDEANEKRSDDEDHIHHGIVCVGMAPAAPQKSYVPPMFRQLILSKRPEMFNVAFSSP